MPDDEGPEEQSIPRKGIFMGLVPLPLGPGWHFVNPATILAVKHMGPKKCVVVLKEGIQLDVSEDSHVVNKRIEDFVKYSEGR